MRIGFGNENYYDLVNELYIENKRKKYDYCIKNGICVDFSDLDKGYDKEYFKSYLNDKDKGMIIVDLPELYGYLFFKKEFIEGKIYLEITEFQVDEKYRGKLVGTRLIEMLLFYASGGWKSDYLKINVSIFNDDMIKFLENLDFVINKEYDNEYEMVKEVNEKGLENILCIYKNYFNRRDNK